MEDYKRECIEFMVAAGALRFGEFVTKSGRPSPYFINTGSFDSGERIGRLGEFYAAAIQARLEGRFDLLYGPAYKGIPLAVATAVALARRGVDVPFAFNRKEAKDHGEGGGLVGRAPREGDRILIIEDVTTAGTSVRESAALLAAAAHVRLAGLAVLVDRQERGPGGRGALAELREEFSLETLAIVTIDEIAEHLHNRTVGGRVVIDDAMLARIRDHRARYGTPVSAG